MCRLPRCQGFRAAPGAAPPLPRPVHRTRAAPAAPRAAGDKLIDPSAGGRRLVATLPPCDPATMCDLRTAEAFGPRGMLLVGFSQQDAAAVQQRLDAIEPGFVAAPCPAALLGDGTLGGALGGGAAVPQHAWEAAPAGTPPVAFFSGMSGEEQVALMEAWGEATGLDAVPAFASGAVGRGTRQQRQQQ